MATITKRGNSYRIRVSGRYEAHGRLLAISPGCTGQVMDWAVMLDAGISLKGVRMEIHRNQEVFTMPKEKKSVTDIPQRAALYIRVSSEEQAMHGLSLIAQRETLVKYSQEHGYKIADVYADEGVTARKKYRNREQFMRMLRAAQSGEIDVILFIKLDRWFRNIADYYEVQRILDDNKVEWIATEERYDTTTANGRLNLNIRLSIAQDESDRTSERIKFVFESKVSRGEVISGKAPLGYKIVNKRLEVDPNTSLIVTDLFNQYLNCRSIRALRKYLMDNHGIVYSHTNIRMLMSNERYIGRAHGMDGFCPAIIDESTFLRARQLIAERSQRNAAVSGRVYLFTGLVYCAECGNRLSAHVVGSKYIYYRCTRYEKLHLCSHKKRTSELILESWLLENLTESFAAYNASLKSRASGKTIQIDEGRIRAKLEKLKDLYLNDLIDRDMYEEEYKNLQESLKSSISVHDNPAPVDLDQIKQLLETYSGLTREGQKAIWSRVVDHITITNDEQFAVFPALC